MAPFSNPREGVNSEVNFLNDRIYVGNVVFFITNLRPRTFSLSAQCKATFNQRVLSQGGLLDNHLGYLHPFKYVMCISIINVNRSRLLRLHRNYIYIHGYA